MAETGGACKCPECGSRWDPEEKAPDGLPNSQRCPNGCNAEAFARFRPDFEEENRPGGTLDQLGENVAKDFERPHGREEERSRRS